MPRTPKNLPKHELIGLQADVVASNDPGRDGLSGTVVDETRDTLVLDVAGEEKQIPKDGSVFRFYLGDIKVRVKGTLLQGRPAERIGQQLPPKWSTEA